MTTNRGDQIWSKIPGLSAGDALVLPEKGPPAVRVVYSTAVFVVDETEEKS